MKLILIDSNPDFESTFKKYVGEWENEKMKPSEDYYAMYKKVFDDYPKFITHLVSLRDSKRLEERKPYVRFYWFVNDFDDIIGTIRYRLNIPEESGNIGYEISPKHRKKGYGTKMLGELVNKLNIEKIDKIQLTLSPDNHASQRVIEHNEGQFLKIVRDTETNTDLNLFEIVMNKKKA